MFPKMFESLRLYCKCDSGYDYRSLWSDPPWSDLWFSFVLAADYCWVLCCFTDAVDITKTCLYDFYPLKPHFYTVKLGFTGVYIIFLISAQKHILYVLVRVTSTHNLCFEQKHEKYQNFLSENFHFLVVNFQYI